MSATQREECLKDDLKLKIIENMRVPKGDGMLRHLRMVGAKPIGLAGNFTPGSTRRL